MNSADVISPVRPQEEPIACPQCGSTSRVGRGLCLNCLLYRGLGEETFDNETLETVLDVVDVRDADWKLGNYQILEEIGRGGMGVIYRARQRHSRRIVARKRILAHHADSRDTLERFRPPGRARAGGSSRSGFYCEGAARLLQLWSSCFGCGRRSAASLVGARARRDPTGGGTTCSKVAADCSEGCSRSRNHLCTPF